MTEQERIKELKVKFLEYYKELPNITLAAGKVGRSVDTISLWRKADSEFSEQMDGAKADWAMRNAKGVRSKEWLLERVLRDQFAQRQELTGKDGESLPPLLVKFIGENEPTQPSTE